MRFSFFRSRIRCDQRDDSGAYDPARQSLYVLDVDDNDAQLFKQWARLIRYDLRTNSSTEILRLPYTHLYSSMNLSSLEDGTLVLIAATPLSYTAWRLTGTGPVATFAGVAAGLGTVLDSPIMGAIFTGER